MADMQNVPQYEAPEGIAIGDYVNRGAAPNYRFDTVDELPNNAWVETDPRGGWGRYAPELRVSTEGTPDARRNFAAPLRQFYPTPGRPPEDFYTGSGNRGTEAEWRRRVETVDGDGWREYRGDMNRKRAAPDIRRTPPPESRVTSDLAPVTYSYTRPFGQTPARHFNGQHFSMADHRRTYDVYGMAPVHSRRNTYRADPLPWDTDIVDRAPAYDPAYSRITSVEVPDSAGRSWRLS